MRGQREEDEAAAWTLPREGRTTNDTDHGQLLMHDLHAGLQARKRTRVFLNG